MAESLYVALVTLVLLCAYRAYDDPKPARFVALGAAIGLATLTRAEGILLGVIVVASRSACCLRGLTARERHRASRDRARCRGGGDRAVDDPQRGALPRVRAGVEQRRDARSTARTATRPTAARSSACGARRSPSSATRRARSRRPRRASKASTSPIRTSTRRRPRAPTRVPGSATRAITSARSRRSRRCACCAPGACTRPASR